MLIINADDWGRSRRETDQARACFERGTVTSVSAMVFMDDSERAAELARDIGIDVGLHLNLTEPWAAGAPAEIRREHERIARLLRTNKFSQVLYRFGLRQKFRLLYEAQEAEFVRLYHKAPTHVDGHQHMHLCANMLVDGVIPEGRKVRRHFSFAPGEKSWMNRAYRGLADWWLSRSHQLVDYFFALSDSVSDRALTKIADLARKADVELMTHPVVEKEFACLMSDCFRNWTATVTLGSYRQIGS